MYPTIKIQGEEALVKFPSSSFFIKAIDVKEFEEAMQYLIEKFSI